MNDKYKVVVYSDGIELEKGLNLMTNEGYKFVALTRGVSGFITVVYEKQQ